MEGSTGTAPTRINSLVEYNKVLTRQLNAVYPNQTWQRYATRSDLEWSGPGMYCLKISDWQGRPLFRMERIGT